MSSVYTIGDRVLYKDKGCGTIRWIGTLSIEQVKIVVRKSVIKSPVKGYYRDNLEDYIEDTDSSVDDVDLGKIYLGIEWDDDLSGECNGEIGEYQVFDPTYSIIRNKYRVLYSEPHPVNLLSCSFLKVDDLTLDTKTFVQAVYERYVDDEENSDNDEFIGAEQARNFFSDLTNLRIISVNKQNITTCGNVSNIKLPRVTTLQLVDNLFSNWIEIIKITKSSPNLNSLDISGNKMSLLTLNSEDCEIKSLKTLFLNRTFIQFDEFLSLCNQGLFPNIETIHLCNNYISTLIQDKYDKIPNLKTINLSNNYISDLEYILKLIHYIPSLKKLLVNDNKLSTINDIKHLEKYNVSHLEELYLENNLIDDWKFVVDLSKIFINLKCLRISGNPLQKTNENVTNECRNILISIFPKLDVLDGSSISENDRTNAERYFISIKSGNNSYTKVQSLDPAILARLEGIHGKREPISDNFLKKDYIEIILVPDGELCDFSKGMVKRSFSSDALIKDVKIVCSKLFKVQYSLIKLVYNDGNMPISLELNNEYDRLDQHGINSGYTIRVKHPIDNAL